MKNTAAFLQDSASHMTANYEAPPFVVARGEGARLWDIDGREYLDFAQGIGVNALGHTHPMVTKAIVEQAHRVCHTSNAFFHRTYIEMCSKLAALSFGPRVFLCNSGTESIEAALKLARRYYADRGEARHEFVAATNGFHGRTMGALSVTGQETYRQGFAPLVPGVTFVAYNDISALEAAVSDKTAALVLEPIQGNGGVVVAQPGYLDAARQLCDKHGVLLILDEVQTGMGRTGKWFAANHDGVVPDMMCLAKALGGGLPLGALVLNEEVARTLQPGVHGTTFGGNPVACAAGLATIQVIESQQLLQRVARSSDKIRGMLAELKKQHAGILEIRGRGLLVGIAFAAPIKPLQIACRKLGLLGTSAGKTVMRLFPPLCVSDGELERCVAILDQGLQQVPTQAD